MNYSKLILGVVFPVFIIIVLSLVGSLDIGLSIDPDLQDALTLDEVYANYSILNQIDMGEIKLVNSFILPKRFEFKERLGCLIDDKDVLPVVTAGNIHYVESNVNYNYNQDNYYNYQTQKSISTEIGIGDTKEIKVYLLPSYNFNGKSGEQLLSEYGEYDYLALVEMNSKNYYGDNPCSVVSKNDLNNGKKVSLEFKS